MLHHPVAWALLPTAASGVVLWINLAVPVPWMAWPLRAALFAVTVIVGGVLTALLLSAIAG